MSKKKIAINGFGRIGRLVFRAYIERVKEFNETFEILTFSNCFVLGNTTRHDKEAHAISSCRPQ